MRRGFSLIELVVVIALIALVGGLVVINAEAILRGLGEEPVERILQKAVREARYQSASLKESTFLSYDQEAGILKITSETGESRAEFALAPESQKDKPGLSFEQILPGQGLEFSREETYPIEQVVFRPDRSSTPFQVEIDLGSAAFILRYDPFSAIVINDSRER